MDVDKANEDKFDALSNYARLDTMVTVVDAINIFDVLHSIETLADKNNATGMTFKTKRRYKMAPEDDRSSCSCSLIRLSSPASYWFRRLPR